MTQIVKNGHEWVTLAGSTLAAIVPPPEPPSKVARAPFGDRLMVGLKFLVLAI